MSIDYSLIACYSAAALLGAGVGATELISRYRDAPKSALLASPGRLYVIVNAVASVSVLRLCLVYDWRFGLELVESQLRYAQTALAGIASLALLRTAVMSVRVGNSDIPIGLGVFLQVILRAADRSIDRELAAHRAEVITEIMAGTALKDATRNLPVLLTELMQNLSEEERVEIFENAEAFNREEGPDDNTKVVLIGLGLLEYVGEDVLRRGLRTLQAAKGFEAKAASDRFTFLLNETKELTFARHGRLLAKLCSQLVPSTTVVIRSDIARLIEGLDADGQLEDRQKLLQLSLLLHHTFGETVFVSAVGTVLSPMRVPSEGRVAGQSAGSVSST